MFTSLYADKAKGILTEQRFLRMTETLEQEQSDNKAWMQTITDELRIASSADSDVRRFIGEIREYASIPELDEIILNRLEELSIKAMTISQIYSLYADNKLVVNRKYQRKLCWTIEEKRNFLDKNQTGTQQSGSGLERKSNGAGQSLSRYDRHGPRQHADRLLCG